MGPAFNQLLDLIYRGQRRLVSNLHQFIHPPGLVPANVPDFGGDHEISRRGLLLRDNPLDSYKNLRHYTERRPRLIHELCAVRANINSNDQVRSQIPRVANRQVRHQTTINQQSSLRITHWNIESRQTNAGANRKK